MTKVWKTYVAKKKSKNQKDFLILSLRRNPKFHHDFWAFFNVLQFIGFTQEFFDSSFKTSKALKILELGYFRGCGFFFLSLSLYPNYLYFFK
jgi:hypothetical protein